MVAKYTRAMLQSAEMSLRQTSRDLFVIFTVIVQPMIIALMSLWMLRDEADRAAIFVVVGSGMTGLWSSLLFISGNSITVERWTGTLETLVGLPTPMQVIIFGKNLANVAQSMLSMVLSYALAALLFGYTLHINQPILFFISMLMTALAFVSFGLIIAPLFLLTPAVQSFQNALEFPIYVLCGFLFPIALLPGWTTPLSYLLTPYWAARALHGASSGDLGAGEIALCWLIMTLMTAFYLGIARQLFEVILFRARTQGTLDMQ